jgi:hypothetical protein
VVSGIYSDFPFGFYEEQFWLNKSIVL